MTDKASSHRLDRLDHLRALAATLVLLWHAVSSGARGDIGPLSILREGHTGVALFCVISGFIFTYVYHDNQPTYGNFLKKRALRIGPMFVLYVALSYFTSGMTPADLAVIFTTTVKYGQNFQSWSLQGWSLLVEVQFYLMFPFLLAISVKRGPLIILGWLGLMVAYRIAVFHAMLNAQPASYWTILGRMDQFLVGMFAGSLTRRGMLDGPLARRAVAVSGIGAVTVLLVFFWWWHDHIGGFIGSSLDPKSTAAKIWVVLPTLEAILYAVILTSYLLAPPMRPGSPLRFLSRGWAFVGRISYSIYLNQLLVLSFCGPYLGKLPGAWFQGWWSSFAVAAVFTFPAVVAFSAITYALVEKPFMDLKPHRGALPPA